VGILRRVGSLFNALTGRLRNPERDLLLLGGGLALDARRRRTIDSFAEVEFAVFSQWGDDGVIQWLVGNLGFESKTFVEFGVQDYREATTRFLLMHDYWSGLVIDGSPKAIKRIRNAEYFWRHDLVAVSAFIDRDNINGLIAEAGFGGSLGILHIDIDGNDYWIWDAITSVKPEVVIVEYNAVFGKDRAITIPYDPTFHRTRAHSSNLYQGASLAALAHLADTKGYSLIGCTSAGNNAYFVRRDRLNDVVVERSVEQAYVASTSRESRDSKGNLTYIRGAARLDVIRGMPVVDVISGEAVTI
jgi:hypothetical protein